MGRPLSWARRERGRLGKQPLCKGKPDTETGADAMRRAAVRNKKSQFYRLFQRWRGALGVRKAIIAVAHRMLLVIWKLLHEDETYTDAGCQLTPETIRRRMLKCVKGLEALGFRVTVARNTPIAGAPV